MWIVWGGEYRAFQSNLFGVICQKAKELWEIQKYYPKKQRVKPHIEYVRILQRTSLDIEGLKENEQWEIWGTNTP